MKRIPKRDSPWLGACVLCGLIGLAPLLRAENALVDVDMTSITSGSITDKSSTIPGLMAITGPKATEPWGSVEIGTGPQEGGGDAAATGAIILKDTSELPGQGVALRVKTPQFGGHSSETGSISIRLLIPIDGQYRAVLFFGNDWKDSAAILILHKGLVSTFVADKTPLVQRGTYTVGKWEDVKMEFNFTKKTFNVYWNGEKIAADVAWINPDRSTIEAFSFYSDDTPINRGGAPVLYVSKIKVVDGD